MTTSETIDQIATACAKAQTQLKPAVKDAINPAFKKRYADLASVTDAARVYATHGVAVFQDATSSEAGVAVETRLVHTSGQWIEFGPLVVPMAKKDAHGLGSATTYAKRYALQAALQIAADEDDDANAAVAPATPVRAMLAVAVPKGFSDWLSDLEAVADEGETALREAWKSSPADLRAFLTAQQPTKWEAIKTRATRKAVTA
jgi:hypothetical protein